MTQAAIKDRRIRFAVVGCGRIAVNHFEALRKHVQNAELVAVCDTEPAALAAVVEKTGARGYSDLGGMLDAAGADVVVLCSPSGLHSRQTISIAQRGLHVVTEKPMATRWSDGLDMVRACDE